MFDRIKKLFSGAEAPPSEQAQLLQDAQRLKLWVHEQGLDLRLTDPQPGNKRHDALYSLHGEVEGKAWRMEGGAPLRDFVHGGELRFRSELGILSAVSVVVMNRSLKNALEKRAFQIYTDSLQTTLDPKLPEEMRWLAIYPEEGWPGLPDRFWDRYAVLASRREHAQAWVTPELADVLLNWPVTGPGSDTPITLALLHARCYLRMEYRHKDSPTLVYAVELFRRACESALTHAAQSHSGGLESDDE